MKVLLVNPASYVYGGAEKVVVNLANYLSENGIENALLTTYLYPAIEHDLKETEIIIAPMKKQPHAEMLALHRGIKNNEYRFDVINSHNYPAEMAVFGCKKPVVWQCNEPILGLKMDNQPVSTKISNVINLIVDRLVVARYINEVIVADLFNANRFSKMYNKTPVVVPYGIDTEFFNLGKIPTTTDFRILQVGMIQPFKNQLESLKVINSLKNRIPEIRLTLAGWALPTYKKILDEYIVENELQDHVVFTGHTDKSSLRELYRSHDLLLHPIKSQGGWLSPFEALCMELPIIVSNEFTATELIRRHNLGIVSCSENYVPDILKIYNNRGFYDTMAQKRKQWVNENLSWNKYGEQMIKVFEKAMIQ